MTRLTTVLFLAALLPALAEVRPFELYQPIIDRAPFGQPPVGFDPTLSPSVRQAAAGAEEGGAEAVPLTEQQAALQRTVNATVIHIDPQTRSPWLGFTDTSDAKAPRHHFVPEKGVEDGWLVQEINLETKTAKLSKDGVEIEVMVGAPAEPKGGGEAKPGARRPGGLLARGSASEETPNEGSHSLRSLRQRRLDQEASERRAAAEAARRQQEELEKQRNEDRAEREAERQEMKESLNLLSEELARRMQESRQQKAQQAAEGGGDDE